LLELNNVEVIYSDVILAVKGISLSVGKGKCVALLGGNGAGKSTTLKAISKVITMEDGDVTAGTISFEGQSTTRPIRRKSSRAACFTSWKGERCCGT
jgi:branched-chain amino acid transport system ATP-binding protein